MRTRGDGLETFLEPIRPEEGQTRDVMRALFLLRGLLRKKTRGTGYEAFQNGCRSGSRHAPSDTRAEPL